MVGEQAKFVIKVVNPTNTGTELEFLTIKAYQVLLVLLFLLMLKILRY